MTLPSRAVAYMRTSSSTNVGADKDSEQRQRAAIDDFARCNMYEIVQYFYDAAVKGSDQITERPGFAAALAYLAANGVNTILVESPDRFARDLTVQLTGHDYLKKLGVALIPTSAPDYFTEETPTAVLVRQVLGAIAEFEKASLVAKLRAARERKKRLTGKCGGRHSVAELRPELVGLAADLSKGISLRQVSAELATKGFTTRSGEPYSASAIRRLLTGRGQVDGVPKNRKGDCSP